MSSAGKKREEDGLDHLVGHFDGCRGRHTLLETGLSIPKL